jgi:hypothetical protein
MTYELIAIIVAIFIFIIKEIIKKKNHYKNQINLLKCLKFKIKEIENMIKSYLNEKGLLIPFYKLPLPDESFFLRNLDFKIKNKKTIDLKYHLNRIEDKCQVINYMIDTMQKEWNRELNEKKNSKKVLDFYFPKMVAILTDYEDKKGLPYSISKIKSILKERFDIN